MTTKQLIRPLPDTVFQSLLGAPSVGRVTMVSNGDVYYDNTGFEGTVTPMYISLELFNREDLFRVIVWGS